MRQLSHAQFQEYHFQPIRALMAEYRMRHQSNELENKAPYSNLTKRTRLTAADGNHRV